MEVQAIFYFLGIFFFLSWFLFLTAVAVMITVTVRWMQQTQAEIRQKIDRVETGVMDKLNQPATTVVASILPLIPVIAGFIREFKRKK
jgi:maltodextrin utilization protein YvdJ